MFLKLAHTQLEVYPIASDLVYEVYTLTAQFPPQEKFGISSQMQRAALSVLLNLAEGSARKSPTERLRFYEIGRASLVELDTALSIAEALSYFTPKDYPKLEEMVVTTFKKISLLIKSTKESPKTH